MSSRLSRSHFRDIILSGLGQESFDAFGVFSASNVGLFNLFHYRTSVRKNGEKGKEEFEKCGQGQFENESQILKNKLTSCTSHLEAILWIAMNTFRMFLLIYEEFVALDVFRPTILRASFFSRPAF